MGITLVVGSDSLFKVGEEVANKLDADLLLINSHTAALQEHDATGVETVCPEEDDMTGFLEDHKVDGHYYTSSRQGQVNNDPRAGFMGALANGKDILAHLNAKVSASAPKQGEQAVIALIGRLTGGSFSGSLVPFANAVKNVESDLRSYQTYKVLIATRSTLVSEPNDLEHHRRNEIAAMVSLAATAVLPNAEKPWNLGLREPVKGGPVFDQAYLLDAPGRADAGQEEQARAVGTFAETILEPRMQAKIQGWAKERWEERKGLLYKEWIPAGLSRVTHDPAHVARLVRDYVLTDVPRVAQDFVQDSLVQSSDTKATVFSRMRSAIRSVAAVNVPKLKEEDWESEYTRVLQNTNEIPNRASAARGNALGVEKARVRERQAARLPSGLFSSSIYASERAAMGRGELPPSPENQLHELREDAI